MAIKDSSTYKNQKFQIKNYYQSEQYRSTHTEIQSDKKTQDPNQLPIKRIRTFKKIRNVDYYVPLYKHTVEIGKENPNYRRISTGLSHNTRELITIDVDRPFLKDNEYIIYDLCDKYKIPHPSYITINQIIDNSRPLNDQNHYQIVWILDNRKAFGKREKQWSGSKDSIIFNNLIQALALRFGGDPNFRGYFLKNPFANGMKTIWVTYNPNDEYPLYYSRDNFKKFQNKYAEKYQPIKKTKKEKPQKKEIKTYDIPSDMSSRNCYAFKNFPLWVWQFMFENKRRPNFDECIKQWEFLEMSTLPYNGKRGIETYNEYKSSMWNAYNWAIHNYDSSKRKFFDPSLQEKGRIKQSIISLCKSIQAKELKEKGFKQKTIASILDCSCENVRLLTKKEYIDLDILLLYKDLFNNPKNYQEKELYKNCIAIINYLNVKNFYEEDLNKLMGWFLLSLLKLKIKRVSPSYINYKILKNLTSDRSLDIFDSGGSSMAGIIICGFPGIGKSAISNTIPGVVDLESTPFNKNWDVYSDVALHMKEKGSTVLVSSHKELREMFREKHIDYVFVVPSRSLKDEYMRRYKQRGNNKEFINFISENWNSFTYPLKGETVFRLENVDDYLFDCLEEIKHMNNKLNEEVSSGSVSGGDGVVSSSDFGDSVPETLRTIVNPANSTKKFKFKKKDPFTEETISLSIENFCVD